MQASTSNAVERLRQHTFEVRDPSRTQPSVEAGMLIKVGVRGERFWCKVVNTVRKDGVLVALVDNDLLRSPWKVGDEIAVLRQHVLEVSDPCDMKLTSLCSTLRPSEAAVVWRELRLMDGSGVKAKPKTLFVLPDM
jgi:hypothetical protein